MKNNFYHDNFDTNKKFNPLPKFVYGQNRFYDMFKIELDHTNFYCNEKKLWRGDSDTDILDTQIYNLNSLGYRAREFSKDVETNTLMFGCSTSFGQGVPEDQSWTNQLSKLKNIEILNMAVPGTGIARYLEDLLLYCNQFGKPKNVIVLAADLFRLRFLNDTQYHWSEGSFSLRDDDQMVDLAIGDMFLNTWDLTVRNKYVEIPFNSKDYISPYYGLYQNLWSMYAIESFCHSSGINLFWSTYNGTSKDMIKELLKNKAFFKNFLIDDDLLTDEERLSLECKDSHGNPYSETDNWIFGTDKPWAGRSHPGIHLHTHVAEFFDRHLGVDNEGNLYKIPDTKD